MCHLFAHQPQRDYESQTRSLRIGGHCTSIRLEMAFWDTLEEIAAKESMSLGKFLTTLAGRSTTSPAAMRLTTCSGSWRTGMNSILGSNGDSLAALF